MRPARLLAVAVLAVVLALSSAQSVFASAELVYDHGNDSGGFLVQPPACAGVRFSLPSGWSAARLLTARFRLVTATVGTFTFGVRVLNLLLNDLITPVDVTIGALDTSVEFSPTSHRIIVTGDFYLA